MVFAAHAVICSLHGRQEGGKRNINKGEQGQARTHKNGPEFVSVLSVSSPDDMTVL